MEPVRVVVIGGGPAGYTAALYAARAGLRPLCIEGFESGGQISRSSRVENYPGFPAGIGGAELAGLIREQAIGHGARTAFDDVTAVDLAQRPFLVTTTGSQVSAEALIIATGSRPRLLDVPGEAELTGRGVAFCAVCDGPLFAGRRVVVVGGGDAAVEEVLSLRRIAAEVTLVHRRPELRAGKASQQALAAAEGIRVVTSAVVEEVLGDDEVGLTAVKLRDLDSGQTRYQEADGLFVAVGQQPATSLFASVLETDRHGYLVTEPGSTATSLPGVFAAGDVADPRYRQAITAAGSGCSAAIDAERWLLGAQSSQNHSTDRPGIPVLR